MWKIPLNRSSVMVRGVAATVAGLFGILWTIFALHVTADAPFPSVVKWVFPAFGVLFTLSAWGQAVWHFIHATSEQKFAQDDDDRIPPVTDWSSRGNTALAGSICSRCRAPLQTEFRYCPQCGQKCV